MRVSQGERVCPPLLPPPPWRIEGWEAPCTAGGRGGGGDAAIKSHLVLLEKRPIRSPHPQPAQVRRPQLPLAATPLGIPH